MFSSPLSLSTPIVYPYNALLSTHWLLDHTDISFVLDNAAISGLCHKKLEIERPSFGAMNRLIAKTASSITMSLRFECEGHGANDLNQYQTNLVPFPRTHFLTVSMAPMVPIKDAPKYKNVNDVLSLSESCVSPQNFLVKYDEFDHKEDKYMSIGMNFSGKGIKVKDADAAVYELKGKKVSFVEWTMGFKVGVNPFPAAPLPNDECARCERSAVMMGNNTAIGRWFSTRIRQKFDGLYSQREFVHWYVGEGMEEGEFAEAREDLGFLEKDYLDILSEQVTDEDDYDTSDNEDAECMIIM